jgi:phosphoglycolate phosphatase-like HAD superfamily hydrolase
MEVKQKEFFIPIALKIFDLYAISGILRKTWEFINLYSVYRGGNRFISLIRVFDLLNKNTNVLQSQVKLPDMETLRKWVNSESRLGNETLRKYVAKNPGDDLEKVLEWSEAVNSEIGRWLRKVPAFPHAKVAIRKISSSGDLVIVSQTPLEALDREWEENDLKKLVRFIAAQEHGTKAEHISLAAKGKYDKSKILMIGDAIGDLEAARSNGALFYPVIPGREDESWKRFLEEGWEKFINGKFRGEYQENLIAGFRKSLPESQKVSPPF